MNMTPQKQILIGNFPLCPLDHYQIKASIVDCNGHQQYTKTTFTYLEVTQEKFIGLMLPMIFTNMAL